MWMRLEWVRNWVKSIPFLGWSKANSTFKESQAVTLEHCICKKGLKDPYKEGKGLCLTTVECDFPVFGSSRTPAGRHLASQAKGCTRKYVRVKDSLSLVRA